MKRRDFLRRSAGVISLGTGAGLLAAQSAHAQTGGHRALICLFLYGGNDGINMVPRVDADGYTRYSSVRGGLALSRSSITQLDANYGLHPNLAPLKPVWDEGSLALILNAGPLARPMTKDQYLQWRGLNNPAYVPESLYSHEDQQILWQNADSVTVTSTGWGGRLMDRLGGADHYSFAGTSRFGAGMSSQELVLPGPGSTLGLNGYWDGRVPNARRAALDALVASSSSNVLQARYASLQRSAFDTSTRLGPILKQQPSGSTADPANPELSSAFGNLSGAYGSGISRQLYQVAKMIKNRATVGGSRHLFFVSMGGFDNHANLLSDHGALMGQMGPALAAFNTAMKNLGVADQVTLFTESDFGRTFLPNSTAGVDHAWGNQQLVMGGAVQGRAAYGTYPSLLLGGPDDAGAQSWEHQGRWIPSVSVDQYAATLASWFAPELVAQLPQILPNLNNFTVKNLGFMRAGV